MKAMRAHKPNSRRWYRQGDWMYFCTPLYFHVVLKPLSPEIIELLVRPLRAEKKT